MFLQATKATHSILRIHMDSGRTRHRTFFRSLPSLSGVRWPDEGEGVRAE
jgi:hypothetical protein